MADNTTRKAEYRCAIFGTAGAYGKPRYFESLEQAKSEIQELIRRGITTFVTDARDGFGLDLAVFIQELRESDPGIHLVVVRPYPNFRSNWNTLPILRAVMEKADMVKYMSETEENYSQDMLNEWILSHCKTVLYVKRSTNAKISRIEEYDLSDKTVIYVPDMPAERTRKTELSKSGVYPANLISAMLNVDPENIDLQDYPEDIEKRLISALEYCLKEREVFVMKERYVEGKTLQEIGDSLGVTRERIRQLITKSLRKLRYHNKMNGILTDGEANGESSDSKAGQKWTPGEEKLLLERYDQGLSIDEIAVLHGRGKGGIIARLKKLGLDPDERESLDNENGFEREPSGSNISGNGLDLNEIVVVAAQVPGEASFDNYDALKSYLKTGLETYNNTEYSLDNIEQARRDHFVLKSVRKKLTDTKKSILAEYSVPIEQVVQQLDELIDMVNGPYRSLDRMLKSNAKEIKRLDIMNYAQSKANVLGSYADSVLYSPSFLNPKWCNASFADSKWKREVDELIQSAKDNIEHIINSGYDDVGLILGYYFDKLTLSGIDSFLYNVKREEAKRQPETVYIDVNTGEIIEQSNDQEIIEPEPPMPGLSASEQEPGGVIMMSVTMSGTKEQIDRYISVAPQYNVKIIKEDSYTKREERKADNEYSEWVNKFPDYVVLRKEGWLWRAKEECATVLANALDYQIMERENGIREAGSRYLDKIQAELIDKHINHVVIHSNSVVEERHFDDNKYRCYL